MYYFASYDPSTKRVLSVLNEGAPTVEELHKRARKLVGGRRWAHVVIIKVVADVSMDWTCDIAMREPQK